MIISFKSYSQNFPVVSNSAIDTSRRVYLQNSPTNTLGNRRELEILKDSSWVMWLVNRAYAWQMRSNPNMGTPINMMWLTSDSGRLMSTPIGSVPISSFLNDNMMTVSRATDSITAINAGIATKYTTPAGTTVQYVRGDGSLATMPTASSFSFNNTPARSIVTVAAAANGFQISSTKTSFVHYSVKISCAVQIGVATNVEGYIVLEVCATNSSTAGDWIEVGRVTNGQNISLAIALASTQVAGFQLNGVVPIGYYCRMRSVNTSGTPTYSTGSQEEVTY